MAAQPLSIDTERRGGGTPNSEILGPEVLKLPPSLDDIDGDASRGFPMLSDLLDDVERRIPRSMGQRQISLGLAVVASIKRLSASALF